MVDVKRDRPKMFEINDLEIEKIAPKAHQRSENTEGVDNFKKWFKEMKK